MKKRYIAAFVALGVIVLLPSIAMYFVVSTTAGLAALASRLDRIGSVTLRIEGVEGTLLDGFRIAVLDIDHPRAHLHFTQVRGRLLFAPLIWRTIDVPELAMETALIEVRRSRPGAGAARTPRFLPAMLQIHGDKLEIARGTLVVPNGNRFDATQFTASADIYPQQIRIRGAQVDLPNMHVAADGRLLAANPVGLEGKLNLTYQAGTQPEWVVATSFDGDLDALPLEALVTAPFHAQVKGEARDLSSAWKFGGDAKIDDLDLVPFGGGKALGKISGTLAVTLDRDGFTGKGELDPAGLEAGRFNVDAAGSYADKVLTLRDVHVLHAQSRAALAGRGTVGIVDGGPRLALAGSWQNFRWPLADADAPAHSARGSFTLEGLKPWKLEAQGDLVAATLPSMPVTLAGRLGSDRLDIDSAELGAFDGTAQFKGVVTWSPQQTWSLTGTATDVNPARLRPDLPGKLSFGFAASGSPFSADGDLDVKLERIAGTLRRNVARGGGQAQRRGDNWRFDKVDVQLGTTRLALDGSLGAQRDLRFSLRADDLSLLTPDAMGKVQASGELAGTATAPVLKLKASGTEFQLGEDSLQKLDADLDIDLRDNGTLRGKIQLQNFLYAGRNVVLAEADLAGTAAAHKATIALHTTHLALKASASGSYLAGTWKGVVDGFDANDDRDFRVALEAPAPLQVTGGDVRLGALCLKGGDAHLCAALERVAQAWHATFNTEQLPLRALTAGLSADTDYDGTINLEAEASGSATDPVTGVVHASLRDARLLHRLSNGREERFAFGTGTVDATATAGDFAVTVGLDAGDSGHIRGNLEGRRTGTDWHGYPITGSLELETDALSLIDIYFGGIDRAAGRLTTAVSIAGTLGQPRLEGELHVRDGEIDLYQVNLALRELTFDAKFNGTSLDVSGNVKAGDGKGSMTGQITWRDREPYGKIHLSGEDLRVVNIPEARIHASPDLDFQIAGRRMDVTGEVLVPYATIDPADITNAVLSSGDEVLVGRGSADAEQRLLVVSNIKLTLGERVTINTYGLSGRLTGSINTRTDESQVSYGSGELNVEEGKYNAYGRSLEIERGRLFFNNGPLADPGIDLRAQKVYPDVTAGINVRGTLRAPRMTFFSEPAIPQSQIVSLIFAGGSLESVQNGSRSGGARNDVLMQGGAILAQQLGSRVGIEDVSIESDLTNDTSLVLGKYLSPRLYVSYGISLAEAINTVKLRYTIGDHWTIKTESGKARSADLVYTILK